MARQQDPAVREFILQNVEDNPSTVSSLAAKKFGLSRTGIGRYMSRLVEDGLLSEEGKTRARKYELKNIIDERIFLVRDGKWNEDTVWRERVLPLMKGIKQNIIDIMQYGITEMINNVLDHSASPSATILYQQNANNIIVQIIDYGVGIFNKIQSDFKLEDARTALLELSKGKLTSDRKHHSGEGIYFTSRMFDKFSIISGSLYYGRFKIDDDDWLIESRDKDQDVQGTCIKLTISTKAEWTRREVFERYQGDDIYFRKTHIPIVLGRYPGEKLTSRSSAKRIMARVTDFSEVMLDFKGVDEIGQGFADEIFRVFKDQHPGLVLDVLNANENVRKMIVYVTTNGSNVAYPDSAQSSEANAADDSG